MRRVEPQIEVLDVRQARIADRYVLNHPQGTPFHETRWSELVRSTFGFETYTLVARQDREIRGLRPLSLVAAPITGRRLISVPFGVYGGILSSDDEVTESLDQTAQKMAREMGVNFLETRYLGQAPTDHEVLTRYETYRKELPSLAKDVMGTIPRKARAEVRKGAKRSNLQLVEGRKYFGEFFRLYLENKQSLGSPVFSASYFRRLLDLYGNRALIHGVVGDGKMMAAVLSLVSRGVIYPYYSGAARESVRLGANNYMYASLMEDAVERGFTLFDFGRSRVGSGAAAFKKNMGFEATPLEYQFFFPKGGRLPTLSPGNPRLDLPRRMLSSMPTWMARALGPSIMRHVP